MRKLLLALPLVAGASWAGTTYYSGAQTEPAYDRLLSQLNQLKPFKFVSEQYDAGFMQSTAVTKVLFEGAPDSEPLFRLKHVIDHSPVGVDNAGTRIGANSVMTTLVIEKMDSELEAALSGRDPMVLHTRVDMTGSTVNDLTLADISIVDDNETLNFAGGNFKFVSEKSGRVHGTGSTKALKMTKASPERGIEVAEAPLAFDVQYHTDDIYSGTMSWDFPSLKFTDPGSGMAVTLKQLKLASDSDIKNDRLNSTFTLSVDELDSPLPLTSFKWDSALNGLALGGIEKMEKLRSEITSSADEIISEGYLEKVADAYKSLFAPGTEFTTDINAKNQGGDMNVDIGIKFKGDGSTSGIENLETVRDLLTATTVKAALNADASAVDMTPLVMFMGHPMAAQYIINDGVTYTTNLRFEDILLYANGETQDIVEMFGFGPMLDTPLDILGSL